jgi:hypothetical protein
MDEHAIGKFKRWLLGGEKIGEGTIRKERAEPRSPRKIEPEVVVHYWDGSAPGGRQLRDLSQSGAYIYTSERWYPGTIIRIVLQGNRLQGHRTTEQEDGTAAPAASTCVSARVVRHGSDGVAVEFAFRHEEELASFQTFLAAIRPRPAKTAPPDATPHREG